MYLWLRLRVPFTHNTHHPDVFAMKILYGSVESTPGSSSSSQERAESSSQSQDHLSEADDPREVAFRVGLNSLYREGYSQTYDEESPILTSVTEEEGIVKTRKTSQSLKVASAAGLIFSLFLLLFASVYRQQASLADIRVTEKLIAEISASPPAASDAPPGASASGTSVSIPQSVCSLNASSSASKYCPRETTAFLVGASPEGRWPRGFSWKLLKDATEETVHRSALYSISEEDAVSSYAGVKCQSFVTNLCLSGKYIVYANSETDSVLHASSVSVCNTEVLAGEALDFDVTGGDCTRHRDQVQDGKGSEVSAPQQALALSYSLQPLRLAETRGNADTESPFDHRAHAEKAKPKCYIFGLACDDSNSGVVVSRGSEQMQTTPSSVQQPTLRTIDFSLKTSSSEDWIGIDKNQEKLHCTLFGLYCKPANQPTYEPTMEPTMMPSYPPSHWNTTTVVQCHFFGLWCVPHKIPETPKPSYSPTCPRCNDDWHRKVREADVVEAEAQSGEATREEHEETKAGHDRAGNSMAVKADQPTIVVEKSNSKTSRHIASKETDNIN